MGPYSTQFENCQKKSHYFHIFGNQEKLGKLARVARFLCEMRLFGQFLNTVRCILSRATH